MSALLISPAEMHSPCRLEVAQATGLISLLSQQRMDWENMLLAHYSPLMTRESSPPSHCAQQRGQVVGDLKIVVRKVEMMRLICLQG